MNKRPAVIVNKRATTLETATFMLGLARVRANNIARAAGCGPFGLPDPWPVTAKMIDAESAWLDELRSDRIKSNVVNRIRK